MKKTIEIFLNEKTYLLNSNFLKKSKFQNKLSSKISQCLNCERKCKINVGKTGHCQTRINHKGEIYTIVYGVISAKSINPIEKKPLYHFYPGSRALTIGTYGCNFDCFWCQNHDISHPELEIVDLLKIIQNYYSPEKMVNEALKNNCQGTSISFNEPTLLFEYSLDVFKLARKKGLYNTFVSNGYMTENVLKELIKNGLDAINIDIKGDFGMVKEYCGADVEKIWRNAILAKKLGVHVEITTLVIDNMNSNDEIIKEISERIVGELGELTPFHLNRFFPQYKSAHYEIRKATPLKLLKNAFYIAKKSGLKFVYLGNISNNIYSNTTCPNCLKIVLKRNFFNIEENNLDFEGKCKYCGFKICVI